MSAFGDGFRKGLKDAIPDAVFGAFWTVALLILGAPLWAAVGLGLLLGRSR